MQSHMDVVGELVRVSENLELHHPERDKDWMRPQDLREVLRLLVQGLITSGPQEVTK